MRNSLSQKISRNVLISKWVWPRRQSPKWNWNIKKQVSEKIPNTQDSKRFPDIPKPGKQHMDIVDGRLARPWNEKYDLSMIVWNIYILSKSSSIPRFCNVSNSNQQYQTQSSKYLDTFFQWMIRIEVPKYCIHLKDRN